MPNRSARGVWVLGEGPPLVLVPGVQGRWEWMRPAVKALSRRFRVITFSLAGEPGTARGVPPPGSFDAHVDQLEAAMDAAGAARAVVCGVSYGGLVAVRTAALRPARVERLVLVSTPGPRWQPTERLERYARSPWASAPAFVTGAVGRLWGEISAARPAPLDRSLTIARYLAMVGRYPASPARMAARLACLAGHDFAADARAVRAPSLVITGEADLDRVVPVSGTREYLQVIPDAVGRTLERTGHLGLVTRSREFAETIEEFSR